MKYHFRNYYFILCITLIWSIIFDIVIRDFKFGIKSTFILYIMGILIYEIEFYSYKLNSSILHILIIMLVILIIKNCFDIFTLVNTSSLNFKTYFFVACLLYFIYGVSREVVDGTY